MYLPFTFPVQGFASSGGDDWEVKKLMRVFEKFINKNENCAQAH